MSNKKPFVLCILDGWGHREETSNNAIANANTPVLDNLWSTRPSTLISGSGMDVGLPDGQMGNSEVGHVNLGAGRVVYQDFTRISKAIDDGDFFTNDALVGAVKGAVNNAGAVHIFGLLSPGGVHSHEDHIHAMIKLAEQQGANKIYVHAFLDGRDTPPRSAEKSIAALEAHFAETKSGKVATLIGRYYAMDRDNRWDRVEQAYNLLTLGEGQFEANTGVEGLQNAYDRDENDEFVKATVIGDKVTINDGDSIVFMNFRADRAREITRAFVEKEFDGFERKVTPQLHDYVMLTEYAADIDTTVAFPPVALNNVMGEWLAKHNKTQLRISETEKYAHVTFFFSGGREDLFEGEDRELIPSPQVATYDLQPEMNSEMLTDKLVEAIKSGKYDFIVVNYPNGDMVGHSGVYEAAVKACEAVDACIGRVVEALEEVGGEGIITADHGNAEQMSDPSTGQAHTAHTSEPVPFIYVGRDAKPVEGGVLSDVAPTILTLMGMERPQEMTGKPLMLVD
ncbi:2,3-bisphosphoglycerate-independent phosphoglycerate mutase [Psychrosphaera ytuae]|uniref:2,3-bisphosphoglycerate-independent phosphoglycerate mutase n=1 Tax=Psychrosphaera ytuae TaxID=2820710 RepID=A0A975D9D2_9GAMM|nr:2,3-bisphosphoglycerate-independent phosphoglycerate mutase [Psychrosphaera ytuae]QTH62633.1 2,3-bisphosphoglycerate-independent phosphoglycerate mutase [Psychrosphaera ytuae]